MTAPTTIATLLARTLQYLEERDISYSEDDDLRLLEEIAADIAQLGATERKTLANALTESGASHLIEGLGIRV